MRWNRIVGLANLVAVTLGGASCSGDTSGPGQDPVPMHLAQISGAGQTGEVGAPLPIPLAVKITDKDGDPIAGVPVTFAVTRGGGSVSASTDTTDAEGLASTIWTMGPDVRVNQQRATAGVPAMALPLVGFTATATLTSGTLSVLGGDQQRAVIRTAPASRPRVLVKTPGSAGVPVAGVEVDWAVTAGDGTLSAASSVTDQAGVASVIWTLGGTVGANTQGLSATVSTLTDSSASFVASTTGPPATILIVSGDGQEGIAGALTAQPVVVLVQDAWNNPVAGATVQWRSTATDWGLVVAGPNVSRTDGTGQASAVVRLGPLTGVDQLESRVVEQPGAVVLFTFTTLAGPPALMSVHSGQYQTGVAGSTLAEPIAVLVTDLYGNPTAGATVYWGTRPENGSTAAESSVAGADGIASTRWTLGTTVGDRNQYVEVALEADFASIVFVASATAGP